MRLAAAAFLAPAGVWAEDYPFFKRALDSYKNQIYLGAVGSVILAFLVDGALVLLERRLTPWARARAEGG